MKIFKKIITLSTVVALSLSSLSYAAIPTDTVIIPGVKRAYDFKSLMLNHEGISDVLAAFDQGNPIYVKLSENMIIDLKYNLIEKNQIPELIYYDENGKEEHYQAGDQDIIDTEPESSKEFKVLDIS